MSRNHSLGSSAWVTMGCVEGTERAALPVAVERAVRAVFDAQYTRLVRLAALLTGSAAVAEDIVQDAFAQVVRRWHDITEPAAYLRIAVVNGCTSWGRSQARQRRLQPDRHAHTAAVPDDALAVRDALAALSEDQRACVVLRYYGGFTEQEVAATLGCSVGTVKSRVHRALARMREELR
jgi:RNA polymerase sigma-70 factor (sigma-E family)